MQIIKNRTGTYWVPYVFCRCVNDHAVMFIEQGTNDNSAYISSDDFRDYYETILLHAINGYITNEL